MIEPEDLKFLMRDTDTGELIRLETDESKRMKVLWESPQRPSMSRLQKYLNHIWRYYGLLDDEEDEDEKNGPSFDLGHFDEF